MTQESFQLATMIATQIQKETKLTPNVQRLGYKDSIAIFDGEIHIGVIIIDHEGNEIVVAAGINNGVPKTIHHYLINLIMQYSFVSGEVH